MAIKKTLQELVTYLEENKDKKIRTVLPEIIEMATAKRVREGGKTHLRDEQGNLVAIRCWFFKKWLPVVGNDAVEFGVKNGTKTGYSTMSKEGQRELAKAARILKNGEKEIFNSLLTNSIDIGTAQKMKEELAEKSKIIPEAPFQESFDSVEEMTAYLEMNNLMAFAEVGKIGKVAEA